MMEFGMRLDKVDRRVRQRKTPQKEQLTFVSSHLPKT
jgi:hypothetical protein